MQPQNIKFLKPMLCQEEKSKNISRFNGDWIAQDKIDGCRAIMFVSNGKCLIQGRENWITHRYPEFQGIWQNTDSFILDGEISTLDNDFNHLQFREQNNKEFRINLFKDKYPCKYNAFDIIAVDGKPLVSLRLSERLSQLEKLQLPKNIEYLKPFSDIQERFNYAVSVNGEGIIIKNLSSCYEFGKRSAYWIKCKNWKEAVVEVTGYEENPKGVTAFNGSGFRVLIAGFQNSNAVKQSINSTGKSRVVIQYLEMTKAGAYRMPTCKEVM